jgi:hypothetical protein
VMATQVHLSDAELEREQADAPNEYAANEAARSVCDRALRNHVREVFSQPAPRSARRTPHFNANAIARKRRKKQERALRRVEREASLLVHAQQVRVSLEEFATDQNRSLDDLLKSRGAARLQLDLLLHDLSGIHGRAAVRKATGYNSTQMTRVLKRAQASVDSLSSPDNSLLG